MRLGPITGVTLIVRQLDRSLAAYADLLGMAVHDHGPLPRQRALDMGDASLAEAPHARLGGNLALEPWLTLIQMRDAPLTTPYARRGWLALSMAVTDVDATAACIDRKLWQVLGEPIDHTTVASTRLMRVAGPDGEVLHLLQRQPSAAASEPLGVLLGAADCGVALGFYEGLGLSDRWRPGPLPNAVHTRAPEAIGQLASHQVIEFTPLGAMPSNDPALRTGLRLVSFARSDRHGRRLLARDDPSARILAGPEGEGIELV